MAVGGIAQEGAGRMRLAGDTGLEAGSSHQMDHHSLHLEEGIAGQGDPVGVCSSLART